MIRRTTYKKQRRGREPIRLCLWMFVLLCTCLHAQPRHGSVLLHPYFKSAGWLSSFQRMTVNESAALDTLAPTSIAMLSQTDDGAVAFVSGDSSIYLMSTRIAAGCVDVLSFDNPVRLGSMPAVAPWSPVAVIGAGGSDTIRIAVAHPTEGLLTVRANVRTGENYGVTTVLTATAAGQIHSLSVEQYNGNLLRLWLTRDRGKAGWARVSAGELGAWTVYSIEQSEDVLCYGDAYIGTRSGRAYRLQDGSFTLDTTLDESIRAISSRGAVGDNGLIAWRINSRWRSTTTGDKAWRHFTVSAAAEGLLLETLDTNFTYESAAVSDLPTRISATDPPELVQAVNGQPYSLHHSDEPVRITLSDPEGNHQIPHIWTARASGHLVTPIIPSPDRSLHQRDPSAPCIAGEYWLNDSLVEIDLSTKITVKLGCRMGAPDLLCFGCAWQEQQFQAETDAFGDTLCIATSVDTLRIVDYGISTAPKTKRMVDAAVGRHAVCHVSGSRLYIVFDQRHSVKSIALYDARGIRILQRAHPAAGAVIARSLPAGVYYALFNHVDRPVSKQRIVIVP